MFLTSEIPMWLIVTVVVIIFFCIYLNMKPNHVSNLISNSNQQIEFKKTHTILDVLKLVSKTNPSKNALMINRGDNNWKNITYHEYFKQVNNFAQSLNYWLGPNTNTGIIGFNSPGWFYAHLGTMLNSGVSIGIYTTSSPEICEFIINNSNIELLVIEDNSQLEKISNINIDSVKLIVYYSPIDKAMINKFKVPVISMGNFMTQKSKLTKTPKPDDTATIIYTSGTTGNPKGVMITHKNIISSLKQMFELTKMHSEFKTFADERIISFLPLNHILAQMVDIYLPIATGSTVWFADKNALKTSSKSSSIETTIKNVKPTIFVGIPRIWEKMVEKIKENTTGVSGMFVNKFIPWKIIQSIGLDECKMAITTSAPISEQARDYLNSLGLQLYDIYGMSETTGPISISTPIMNRKNTVGIPVMDVKISKNNEIMVKGSNLFKGYLNIENSFEKNGYFKTGDLGFIDEDGFLHITGRIKELIITSGGENVSPIPIESNLKNHLGQYFENIIVIGDKKKFLSVLLQTTKKLPQNIDEIIKNSVDQVNQQAVSPVSTIKKWSIIKNNFLVDQELTPTLKLRRDFIQKKYQKNIDKIYED